MDGRQLRRWLICGGLAAALTGCKTGTTLPDTVVGAKSGQAVGPVANKSFWGNSSPKVETPLMPGESPPGPVSSGGKKPPLSPESQVRLAELAVETACTDPPPPNRDQMLDQARQKYQAILKKDPKCGPAMLGMARMYAKIGDREHALEMYRAYLKLKPADHEVMAEVAAKHFQWKDTAGAVAWYDEALKADPQNRTYRKCRGYGLAMAGRFEEGFAQLLEVMPEADARFYLAQIMYNAKQLEQSRQQLTIAIQLDPKLAEAKEILAAMDAAGRPPQPGEANPIHQAAGTAP